MQEKRLLIPPPYEIQISAPNQDDITTENFIKQRELMLKYHTIDDYEKYNQAKTKIHRKGNPKHHCSIATIHNTHTVQLQQFQITMTQTFPHRFQIFKLVYPQSFLMNVYIPPQLSRATKTYKNLNKIFKKHLRGRPLIIGGDFNGVSHLHDRLNCKKLTKMDEHFQRFLLKNNFVDSFSNDSSPKKYSFYRGNQTNNRLQASRIDHILYNDKLLCKYPYATITGKVHKIHYNLAPDHASIQVKIIFSNTQNTNETYVPPLNTRIFVALNKLTSDDIEQYRKHMEKWAENLLTSPSAENTASILKEMHSNIYDSIPKETKIMYKPKPLPKPNSKLRQMQTQFRRIQRAIDAWFFYNTVKKPRTKRKIQKITVRNIHRVNKNLIDWKPDISNFSIDDPTILLQENILQKLKSLSNTITKEIKILRAKQLHASIQNSLKQRNLNFAADRKAFYASLKNQNRQQFRVIDSVEYLGTVSHDPKRIKKAYKKFWKNIFNIKYDDDQVGNGILPPWWNNDIIQPLTPELSQIFPQNEITLEELEQNLKSMRPGRSTMDGIPVELYKWLPKATKLLLVKCLNHIIAGAEIPKTWKKSGIFLIFKKGKRTLPENYRPIALIHAGYKILVTIMKTRFMKVYNLHNFPLQSNSLPYSFLSENQFGFRKKRTCHQAIRTLRNIMDHAKINKNPLYLLFIDLYKAFDSIPHNHLFALLRKLNLPNYWVNTLEAMYTNRKAYIWLPQGKVKIYITNGVLQGCPLSPLLFNTFVDPFIKYLNYLHLGYNIGNINIPILSFADDEVLIGPNRSQIVALCKHKEIFSNYHHLKLSISTQNKSTKTSLTWMDETTDQQLKLTYKNQEIPYLSPSEHYN